MNLHRLQKRLALMAIISGLVTACSGGVTSPLPLSSAVTPPAASETHLPPTPTSVATPRPIPPAVLHPLRDQWINLAHLQHLTEVVTWQGEPVALVHIYSEAPDYGWVDASGEGIACVDDVARAALVYLMFYQRTGEPEALRLARAALNFVLYMQADDGEYYNFVLDRQGTINRTGRTSYKSWNWWAARGQWALASAIPVFREVDPVYAARLEEAYLRGEAALARTMGPVGAYNELHGTPVPAWLISNGSDLSALALLGLAAYYQAQPNSTTRHLLTNLANGIMAYQLGGPGQYPFAAFPSTTTSTALWHAWGSHQVHALALAGRLLERPDWIAAAQAAADTLYVRLLATDFINEMAPLPVRGGQIAYGMQVLTSGFWSLFQATGEERYARYAGLSNAWLFGNNMAGVAMYDPETGRCWDGINGPSAFRINRNAGAESTIEALYALLLVGDAPLATAWYQATPEQTPFNLILEVEDGQPVAGQPTYGRRGWTGEANFSNERYYALKADDAVELPFVLPDAGRYLLYVSHLRRAAPRPERVAPAVRAARPLQLDGDLSEWEAAPWLAADRPEQILRGAASWPGAEKASFTLSFQWDAQFLYVAARVRDEAHVQNEVGPSVWRGDALWLYFNLLGDRRSLDAKLTLAQTPAGPQVWNWRAQGLQPGALLAWQATPTGYTYEAALPWDSLHVNPSQRTRFFFDAGIGFGASGFITWSGLDPDTPANLLPLELVEEVPPAVSEKSAATQSPQEVAFAVTLSSTAQTTTTVIAQAVSPDRDYLWLEPLFAGPLALPAGRYTLRFQYAGQQDAQEAVVDAVWILPEVACKRYRLPAETGSRTVDLCHHLWTGETTWQERP